MDERTKKAFDFAADSTKQLITLSSAILLLTITFSKNILNDVPQGYLRWILAFTWIFYLLSIVFGVGTLLAMTGTLEPKDMSRVHKPSIWQGSIRIRSALQVILFLIATLLIVAFGVASLVA